MTESIMEQIKTVANSTPQAITGKYLYCPLCTCYAPWNPQTPAPTVCPKCNKETGFGLGNDLPSAKAAWTNKSQTVQSIPMVPAVAPVEQQQEPPTPINKPKRAAPKKQEIVQPPAPTEQPPATQAEATPETTARELRRQAIDRLITVKELNSLQFKQVCTAKIYSRGFTLWDAEKKPRYCFMEDIDNAESFRKVLDEARKEYGGNVALDVALLTAVDDDLVCSCLFHGQLIASTFTNRGPISCTKGAKVKVGAQVTKAGNLMFSVLEVL